MKTRFFVLTSIAAALLSIWAACGGGGGGETQRPNSTAPDAVSTTGKTPSSGVVSIPGGEGTPVPVTPGGQPSSADELALMHNVEHRLGNEDQAGQIRDQMRSLLAAPQTLNLGNDVELLGYSTRTSPATSSETSLDLYFYIESTLAQDEYLFVHAYPWTEACARNILIRPEIFDTGVSTFVDLDPKPPLPVVTTGMQPGLVVVSEQTLALAPGCYRLWVGLWNPALNENLPLLGTTNVEDGINLVGISVPAQ